MASIILSVATNANLPNLNALVIPSVTAIVPNTNITAKVPGQATAIPVNVPSTTVIVAGLKR